MNEWCNLFQQPSDTDLEGAMGDLLFTMDQLQIMKDMYSPRSKRKILRFDTYPNSKWNAPAEPIVYKFSGAHSKTVYHNHMKLLS